MAKIWILIRINKTKTHIINITGNLLISHQTIADKTKTSNRINFNQIVTIILTNNLQIRVIITNFNHKTINLELQIIKILSNSVISLISNLLAINLINHLIEQTL